MKKRISFLLDATLILFLLKSGELGLGKEMNWFEVFIPVIIIIGFMVWQVLCDLYGFDWSFKVWVAKVVSEFVNRRRAKRMYSNIMKPAANEGSKGEG